MLTQDELKTAYWRQVAHAQQRARETGAEFYVAATIGVKTGCPYIVGFNTTDWHDSACVCRVSANQVWEI